MYTVGSIEGTLFERTLEFRGTLFRTRIGVFHTSGFPVSIKEFCCYAEIFITDTVPLIKILCSWEEAYRCQYDFLYAPQLQLRLELQVQDHISVEISHLSTYEFWNQRLRIASKYPVAYYGNSYNAECMSKRTNISLIHRMVKSTDLMWWSKLFYNLEKFIAGAVPVGRTDPRCSH